MPAVDVSAPPRARPRGGALKRAPDKRARLSPLLIPLGLVEFLVAFGVADSVMATLAVIVAASGLLTAVIAPSLFLAAAFPSVFGYIRVGPGALGMSLTDLVCGFACIAALPYVPWRSNLLRRLLVALLFYELMIVVSLVPHHYRAAPVEVVHRFVLAAGAIFIGAAIANLGQIRRALRSLFLAAGVISVAAIIDCISKGFGPAFPLGMQKNGAGELLAMCILVVFVAPKRLEWPRTIVVGFGGLMAFGLLATESRGPSVALVAMLALWIVRGGDVPFLRKVVRYAPLIAAVAIAVLVMSAVTIKDASNTGVAAKYNSVNSRRISYDYSLQVVFADQPFAGGGLKWFNRPGAGSILPHNLVVAELSEVGLFGFTGFVTLLVALIALCRGHRSDVGDLAFLAVVGRILESTLGIFWVAGPGTLPFLLIGLLVGDDALTDSDLDAPRFDAAELLR